MSRIPSVTTLQRIVPDGDRKAALRLRKLLDGRLDPRTFDSVEKWVRQCYNEPKYHELMMCAANELLGGHGVEILRLEGQWLNMFYGDIFAEYVNYGDPYVHTLIRDCEYDTYHVAAYGDYLELLERRHKVAS